MNLQPLLCSLALSFELSPFLVKLLLVETYEPNNIENVSKPPIRQNTQSLNLQPPTPDNPPWNWAAALGVWLASFLFLLFIPSIVVVPYIMSKGIKLQDAEALSNFLLNDYWAVVLQIGLIIPVHILTLALSWAVVTNFKKFSFRETLGWKWGGFRFWHVAAIMIGFYLSAGILIKIFGEHDNDMLRILRSSRTAAYLIAFMATFTAPLVEEVVYRGILYSAFQKRFGIPFAVFLTTLLFAAVHYYQYWGDPATLIMITLLSLTLTIVRVKTSNLLPCIVLHTVINGVQAVFIILEPFLRELNPKSPEQAISFFHLIK
jgi:uncharacterized protein